MKPSQLQVELAVEDVRGTIEELRMIGVPGHKVIELQQTGPCTVQVSGQLWISFSFEGEAAEISGTCRTQQDLRDALRELLAMLERS